MQSIEGKVVRRIYDMGRGVAFTQDRFLDLGSGQAVRQALKALADRGTIRRLARGLYDYPRTHPTLGALTPTPDAIAKALAGKDSLRIQPSGAYAANQLGLSLQVPAKVVFLTDGSNRTVKVGNQEIILKRTTPKNMATAGRISGLIIQALRHIGKDHVDDEIIARLDRQLSAEDRRTLKKDVPLAPAWIAEIMRQLAQEK
jgi:hypothetical protein